MRCCHENWVASSEHDISATSFFGLKVAAAIRDGVFWRRGARDEVFESPVESVEDRTNTAKAWDCYTLEKISELRPFLRGGIRQSVLSMHALRISSMWNCYSCGLHHRSPVEDWRHSQWGYMQHAWMFPCGEFFWSARFSHRSWFGKP